MDIAYGLHNTAHYISNIIVGYFDLIQVVLLDILLQTTPFNQLHTHVKLAAQLNEMLNLHDIRMVKTMQEFSLLFNKVYHEFVKKTSLCDFNCMDIIRRNKSSSVNFAEWAFSQLFE